MEIKEIASLRLRAAASPIEIRVVRIWKPPFRDNETCFLLVDRHGDGIQAIAKGKDQSYAEKNLMPKSCYRIEGYACVESEPYVNTLSHPANLRIGVASTFTPVAESDDLPHQYFEFASPRKIQRICGNNKEVTVIALTAVKVKEFSNAKQLWSTRATYVYLNPRCAETEILITKYRIQATISDNTCSINAVLFDEAVKALVGIECINVVTNKIKMLAQKKVTLPATRHKVTVLDEANNR
ncbi:hypothetical protein E3N88_32674 [Mikania micrantha]|uniref:Replication factor A C-terminal domain-containing protein n=1 Tax=Mikania micrantha TaxID=192012 RepID=A0A5N6M952_9ASTR|nr:hypothetical protein E3N88_32674 [Mikania micrantha]